MRQSVSFNWTVQYFVRNICFLLYKSFSFRNGIFHKKLVECNIDANTSTCKQLLVCELQLL